MAVWKLGTFSKPTATGSQTVTHSLGVTPKAIIFFSDVATTGPTSYPMGSLGFCDASLNQGSIGWVYNLSAHKRKASAAITAIDSGGGAVAEASVTAVTSSTFTLNWTVADPFVDTWAYLAIGGSDVAAKVQWFNTRTGTGTQAITGVGFKPDALVFLPNDDWNTSLPSNTNGGVGGLGFATTAGSVAVTALTSLNGITTTRAMSTTAPLLTISSGIEIRAALSSMDSDGFTLNYTTNTASASAIPFLALQGLVATAGYGAAPSATGTQAITSLGFKPEAILFCGSNVEANETLSTDKAVTSFGAATATDQFGMTATTSMRGASSTQAFVSGWTLTGSYDQAATLQSLDASGFTLNWTVRGGAPTWLPWFGYLALATVPAPATLSARLVMGLGVRTTGGAPVTAAARLVLGLGTRATAGSPVAVGARLVLGLGTDVNLRAPAQLSARLVLGLGVPISVVLPVTAIAARLVLGAGLAVPSTGPGTGVVTETDLADFLNALREGDEFPCTLPYAGIGGKSGVARVLARTVDTQGVLTFRLQFIPMTDAPAAAAEALSGRPRFVPAERENLPRRLANAEAKISSLQSKG